MVKILQRISQQQYQKSKGSTSAIFGYDVYQHLKRTGKKVVLDISNYDFHRCGIKLLAYPLPDVSYIVCNETQIHMLLKKWPLNKLYVKTYDWELPRLDQVNIAVISDSLRESKFKLAIKEGYIDSSRSYMLYGLQNPLELSSYFMYNDSISSLIKYVATGIAFAYATFNVRFSRAVGIWKRIESLDYDDVRGSLNFRDDELGYEREETYILNVSILESIARGLNHAKTIL